MGVVIGLQRGISSVSSGISIRPYRVTELNAVVTLFQRSIRELGAKHYSDAQHAAWAPDKIDHGAWQQNLANAHTLIAEVNHHIAGFISFYTKEDATGYIDLLYCCPHHSRQGIASALYTQAEAILYREGTNTLRTHASLSAHAFFTRQGFVVEQLETVSRRNIELPRYAMRKTHPKSPL
ncbi:putative N-acetyltransferase YafP [Zhongshania aliphaticivorans]|nr:putative N-acetyltransferase YafP [Zhongshania aliphaticivorans]